MKPPQEHVLATLHVDHFVRGGLRDSLAEMRPTVERILRSSEPEVCEAGARLVSLAALEQESAANLVDEVLRGGARHRLGVALVASANITVPECRTRHDGTLTALFNGDDADVWHGAVSCFHPLQDEALDTYSDLIAAFCDSRAYREASFSILRALEESLERLPGMTCRLRNEWTAPSLDLIDSPLLERIVDAAPEFEQILP